MKSILKLLYWTIPVWVCIAISTQIQAQALPIGAKSVVLIDREGKEQVIGKVLFEGEGEKRRVKVTVDGPMFSDHFLSMRPFRCIEDSRQWACHLAYPYKLKGEISAQDLMDLEYQLLFIGKKPAEFGINAWNGLYYQLSVKSDGRLVGELQEADFNILSAPPDKDYARPITRAMLSPAGSQPRYTRVEIR